LRPSVYPKQIAIDYTPRGTVYGFVCKYNNGTNTFVSLRSEVEKALAVPPRLENTNLLVWRLEERRLSVTLSLDEHEDEVDLIALSLDKRIRNER
jgi:hypothetical protein